MAFTPEHAAFANSLRPGTLLAQLDIRYDVDEQGRLIAVMPVDERTHQPLGLLHGGATAALAESLGSMGSTLLIDREKQASVGIEVNANHMRGVRSGKVLAVGEIVHRGRTTHVWDIRVTDDAGHLVAVCRLTNLIIDRKP
ncbi:MAG: hotdog fold thioesterase [Flavobacteriales bacterium]|nr:hotdog fold thioesterase [Flavobacteriales bacterium]MCB9194354.1 hotdog fold thioesterase [Flavobacteriales bacterium]